MPRFAPGQDTALMTQSPTERLLEAASGYLMLQMPQQALEELDKVAHTEACGHAFFRLQGEALRQQSAFDAALQAYGKALAEQPDDVSILMGMAWCYKRVAQLPRAIAATVRASRLLPEEPLLMYNLACYYTLQGDKPRALGHLGRALRLNPSLRNLVPDEPDFDALRDDPDFQFITNPEDPDLFASGDR